MNVEDTSSKAMVAIDKAGFDWSYMVDDEVPTNMALMAFSDSKVQNSKTCSNTCLKNFKTLKTQYDNLRIDFNESEFDLATYKRGLASVEEQLLFYKKNETVIFMIKNGTKTCVENIEKGTVQREVRPVWNNAMRTNHQNFSNCRRNFAPTVVLSKSGIVPISTARQSSSRAATPISAARPINTAASKPLVNIVKPRQNDLQPSHSLPKRPFYQQTLLKNRYLNNNVNTAKENSVNTAKGNKVTSTDGNQGINAVKYSTCWVWRPKIKAQDHGAPQDALKDQGYFDNGCSRYMTGNISYLTDFKEHDGGYVTFGEGAKGDKITGKDTIRTADESQALLKVPRKNNMYSLDMKNIVLN
nr:ribonuclease H-like domain-containing protein [Tanacetum cinerariifolium]